jgi:transitional endoplasmic reticulum ATPase
LDLVDPALLRSGRFDLLLELPKPDERTREEIFKIHTKNKPLAKDVDLKELAKETEGKVGSDIEFICKKASMLAIREFIEHQQDLKILRKHFQDAIKLIQNQKEV